MNQLNAADILVVFAMNEEAAGEFNDILSPILYTGIGKINSAWALTKQLMLNKPRLVVDFGTAGSPSIPRHTLVECTRFVQRDMDARPLGFPLGHTPLDTIPADISVKRRLPFMREATCGSADQFVSGHDLGDCDLVEMEAYALAKVCQREHAEFMAVKFITDGGDDSAHTDWAQNLPLAARSFRQLYDRLLVSHELFFK